MHSLLQGDTLTDFQKMAYDPSVANRWIAGRTVVNFVLSAVDSMEGANSVNRVLRELNKISGVGVNTLNTLYNIGRRIPESDVHLYPNVSTMREATNVIGERSKALVQFIVDNKPTVRQLQEYKRKQKGAVVYKTCRRTVSSKPAKTKAQRGESGRSSVTDTSQMLSKPVKPAAEKPHSPSKSVSREMANLSRVRDRIVEAAVFLHQAADPARLRNTAEVLLKQADMIDQLNAAAQGLAVTVEVMLGAPSTVASKND